MYIYKYIYIYNRFKNITFKIYIEDNISECFFERV